MRAVWKLTGLFYCYLNVRAPEIFNQTTLQQEIAMHISSLISPQYDCVFEQDFKNEVQCLPKVSYSITSSSRSRYPELRQFSNEANVYLLINLIYSFDLKDAWIMLLLIHWTFRDVVSIICHFCGMTKLSEVNGLRRQAIIYLKLFSNKRDFIYSHLKFI